jgi:hypothetical protein
MLYGMHNSAYLSFPSKQKSAETSERVYHLESSGNPESGPPHIGDFSRYNLKAAKHKSNRKK